MPTFIHGKGTRVFLDDYEATYWLREAQWQNPVDVAETSTFGQAGGSKTYVVGYKGFTATMGGMYEDTASSGFDAIVSPLLGQETPTQFAIAPRGTAVGNRAWAAQGFVTSYDVQGSVGDMVSAGVQLQGSGTVRSGVSLQPNTTAVTATGNGTTVDQSASTTYGAQAFLFLTTNSRDTGNIVVKVQHSADNFTTSADLLTFTSVNGGVVDSQFQATASGATVNRYVRASYTITGGTSGSYFFTLIFVRNAS